MLQAMKENKTPTNHFSVYLIKAEVNKVEDIVKSKEKPIGIDGIGYFVFDKSLPHPPDWVRDFFGSILEGNTQILTSTAKGVLVVPIRKNNKVRHFAVVFGFGRHLLNEGVIEERFGLKIVLNSLDASSLRSIDKTTLGSIPKHSREQMSKDVAAADFGIDIEQDLVSSVTGKSRDDQFGKLITGKDALNCSVKVDATNIAEFLQHCLERYESSDYKKDFEWIDQITDIRDKKIEEELNLTLVEKLNKRDLKKIWMAVPEIVNWSDIKGFRYVNSKYTITHDDLDIEKYLQELGGPLEIGFFKEPQVYAISASTDNILEQWSMFRCIYAEIELKENMYLLSNGKWYKIAKGFTEQIQKEFESIKRSDIVLPECTAIQEKEYNSNAARIIDNACCMDTELIPYGGGRSSIEFCDIFTTDKKILHVKRYGNSNVLSHLFSQGVVSGEIFISDTDFRKKLNTKLPGTHKLINPDIQPLAREYEIIFCIISESDNPLDIPFFSKVSLKNARRRLMTYGYNVSIKQIKRTGHTATIRVALAEGVTN